MKTSEVMRAWGKILKGERPSLSIEITRECPLQCPGCYAYDDAHLAGGATLRSLSDRKGQALIDGVLELVDRIRPLHLSLVGGDPLVRHRELAVPDSATAGEGNPRAGGHKRFSPSPGQLGGTESFQRCGFDRRAAARPRYPACPCNLRSDHQEHRGQNITIHCTVTGQMMKRPGSLRQFLEFWTPRAEIRKVWFSLFTPQIGDQLPEMLRPEERERAIADMLILRKEFLKLDMPEGLIRQFAIPPPNPKECVFALTTETVSADLKTKIVPCQFGGNPDCASCGCIASMGLAAVAAHKLGGVIPIGAVFGASIKIGSLRAKSSAPLPTAGEPPRILSLR